MRIKKTDTKIVSCDLTPMIDMTFQLIAFFMVVINFTETEQDQRIKLPISELAKPSEHPPTEPLFLQLTDEGNIIWQGELTPLNNVRRHLEDESEAMRLNNKTPADATVIIRADAKVATGKVQDLIRICQESRFERFHLRAQEKVTP